MAYALNIFGPITRHNLDVVRHIRNAFTHAKQHITFDNKEINDLCAHFLFPQEIKSNPNYPEENIAKDKQWSVPKHLFVVSASITEISLVRFTNKKLKNEIEKTTGEKYKESDARVMFDDSLP